MERPKSHNNRSPQIDGNPPKPKRQGKVIPDPNVKHIGRPRIHPIQLKKSRPDKLTVPEKKLIQELLFEYIEKEKKKLNYYNKQDQLPQKELSAIVDKLQRKIFKAEFALEHLNL